jgi:hypothetical protein
MLISLMTYCCQEASEANSAEDSDTDEPGVVREKRPKTKKGVKRRVSMAPAGRCLSLKIGCR